MYSTVHKFLNREIRFIRYKIHCSNGNKKDYKKIKQGYKPWTGADVGSRPPVKNSGPPVSIKLDAGLIVGFSSSSAAERKFNIIHYQCLNSIISCNKL